jgi:hypothetical protein
MLQILRLLKLEKMSHIQQINLKITDNRFNRKPTKFIFL